MEEPPRAGSGPETKAGLRPPIFHTAVRVHPMLGILCDYLGSFLSPYTYIKMLAMANLLFSHSSSTGLSLQPGSTSKSCPYSSECYRCRTQGSPEGRSRPETSLPKGTRPAGNWPACWADRISVPTGPPATGTNVPPLSENTHLHLHLYLLGLWQENPSQGMSHHLCRESLPCLQPKTQMQMMPEPSLQGEWVLALDRDPEPFLETSCLGEWLALQPLSLPTSCGCHQLAPHRGQIECPSPELICISFVCSFLVMFYFFCGFMYFFLLNFCS